MLRRVLISVFLLVIYFNLAFPYKINFKNISLKDFVNFVAEFTGSNFVYNEKELRGFVTISSQSEMSKDDVIQILSNILKVNGFTLVNKGNYYQIIRSRDLPIIDSEFEEIGSEKGVDYKLVTAVIEPENINAEQLFGVYKTLKSRYGQISLIRGIGVIVVKDTESKVAEFLKILSELEDKARGLLIRSIKLKYVLASKVESKLNRLYMDLKKNGVQTFMPVVISDDLANVIIVAGSKTDIERALFVVGKLDVLSENTVSAPKVFYLKNANASDVEKIISKVLGTVVKGSAKRTKKKVLFSVASDKATNSIIVVGDPEVYNKVESLIKKLDIPRDQVYVEALIVETSLENLSKFGLEWIAGGGTRSFVGAAGYLESPGTLRGFQAPVLTGQPPNFTALPGGFTMGILGNIITYEGVRFPTLSALASALRFKSGINILSNPQILTLDNEKAEIFVGESRPFVTSVKYDSNNNPIQTYDYRDVGVMLRITPHISDNETIVLDIYQEVKKTIANVAPDIPAPITLTRKTKTKVKLKNGYTMVISGLMKNDSSLEYREVPFLAKIPIIGWFFKAKSDKREKTNLMIFISPHIIRTFDQAVKITEDTKRRFEKQKRNIKNELSD